VALEGYGKDALTAAENQRSLSSVDSSVGPRVAWPRISPSARRREIVQIPPLNDNDLKELEGKPVVAKIATTSSKGEVRISPVWFGADNGTFVINTFEDSGLIKNLRQNPKCSLLIDTTEWPYVGVHYWGTATVEGPENDIDGMEKMFAPYVGNHEASNAYSQKLVAWGKRVYVRFRPERKTTWDFTQG
jgi:hypothetical protein